MCPLSLPLYACELCSPNCRVGAAGSKGHVHSCGMHQHVPAWPRPRAIPPWFHSLSCLEKAFHCFILSCSITSVPSQSQMSGFLCLMVHLQSTISCTNHFRPPAGTSEFQGVPRALVAV